MAVKLCYNRGCGKEFNIRENSAEACRFHPGAPYFHDAYKGWSCCQNKSTDFTTFLNTPGCTLGKHSNVKPIEPEKITGNLNKESSPEVVIEVRPPIQPAMTRPDVKTPMTRLSPTIAASLVQAIANMPAPDESVVSESVKEGEACKNNGCKQVYPGTSDECKYHPGFPVFHEGMKYWSCCQRKTTEFQHFLDQEGCDIGCHKWVADKKGADVKCRYDWHQTATHITVAIYAKKYDPAKSFVELNPVRLVAHLFFPIENGIFDLDVELKGVVEVESTTSSMLGTKVEIKMKKAEPGSWAKLDIPKPVVKKDETPSVQDMSKAESTVDALELDDLDITPTRMSLSKEAQMKPNYA